MKILLSAYACEPNKGSEPGVGWNWAIELATLGHDVWVLTRANNQAPIEAELGRGGAIENLHFLYYDLPEFGRWLKKLKGGIYAYYVAWQLGAYQLARRSHKQVKFDRVHHITFGTFRQPSFMGLLKIPFMFGPVGGGERAPFPMRESYPLSGRILDALRDIVNWLALFDPLNMLTYKTANTILCKTPETLAALPRWCADKGHVQLEIGIRSDQGNDDLPIESGVSKGAECSFLYVGRLIYWKGLHLALAALAEARLSCPSVTLIVVGAGPDEKWLRAESVRLGVSDIVEWHTWLPQSEVMEMYKRHYAFLFPSLHDSSGNVVLESLAAGLPVVCLDLGGPAMIVDESCALISVTAHLSEKEVVANLAANLVTLSNSPNLRASLTEKAKDRAKEFSWGQIVAEVYDRWDVSQ
jgi:glycosyltransferase involved in cell wall biosynthesis